MRHLSLSKNGNLCPIIPHEVVLDAWTDSGKAGISMHSLRGKGVIANMYNKLKGKSKIFLGKRVVRIEYDPESVLMMCADGAEFEVDIVIGADGIHSRTRKEMQRLALKGFVEIDKNSESQILISF